MRVSAEDKSLMLRGDRRVMLDLLPKLLDTETEVESVQTQPRAKNELLLLLFCCTLELILSSPRARSLTKLVPTWVHAL